MLLTHILCSFNKSCWICINFLCAWRQRRTFCCSFIGYKYGKKRRFRCFYWICKFSSCNFLLITGMTQRIIRGQQEHLWNISSNLIYFQTIDQKKNTVKAHTFAASMHSQISFSIIACYTLCCMLFSLEIKANKRIQSR